MLILSRRIGEAIVIADNIRIVFLGARGSCVKLGFEAPHDVTIHREEVWKKINVAVDQSDSDNTLSFNDDEKVLSGEHQKEMELK